MYTTPEMMLREDLGQAQHHHQGPAAPRGQGARTRNPRVQLLLDIFDADECERLSEWRHALVAHRDGSQQLGDDRGGEVLIE